jgi:hypothetical protein
MSRAREAAYALFGAYRLAHLDPSGLQHFNATVQGFWRSFLAALIVAPGYAIIIALELVDSSNAAQLDWVGIALVQSVFYALGWVAFPLVMLIVTDRMDRRAEYLRYMVAYNWSAVLQMGLMLPASALEAMLPGGAGGLIMAVVWAAVTFYQWFIARTALRITGGAAATVVLLDILLSFTIAMVALKVRTGGLF